VTEKILPTIMIMPVGYACGCRCVMCSIWTREKKPAPPVAFYEDVFRDERLKKHLRKVNLTGGEPFLRSDIADIVAATARSLPALEEINVSSNGMFPDRMMAALDRIAADLPEHVAFNIYFSLDGIGSTHNRIRGVKTAFGCVMEAYFRVRELLALRKLESRWRTGFSTTVSTFNYREVDLITNTLGRMGASFGFTVANESDVFLNTRAIEHTGWKPDGSQVEEIARVFERLYSNLGNPFYRMTALMLRGAERPVGCFYQTSGFLLDVDGSVYLCGSHEDCRIGNVGEARFSDLWFSEVAARVRQDVKEHCRRCMSDCYAAESLTEALLASLVSNGQPLILFGAGSLGRQARRRLAEAGIEVSFFVDNDPAKWHTNVMDTPVVPPSEITARRDHEPVVITSAPGRAQIKCQLEALGLVDGRDFVDMPSL
jgi:Fe-coproporphyrin III synthase